MGWDYLIVRPQELPADDFAEWVKDVCRVIATSTVSICGPDGDGDPVLLPDRVALNGDKSRTHTTVFPPMQEWIPARNEDQTVRGWVKGEIKPEHVWEREEASFPFTVARYGDEEWRAAPYHLDLSAFIKPEWVAEPFVTGYLPYDEVVTASLALLADRFPRLVAVTAHGVRRNWDTGLALAEQATGKRVRLPAYMHRWRLNDARSQPVPFDATAIAAWSADVARVLVATNVPLAGPDGTGTPVVTPEGVAFNGRGDDALGAFAFPHRWGYYGYCITGQRPYDAVVTAALVLLAYHLPDALIVQVAILPGDVERRFFLSHGTEAEWEPGLRLAREATGRDLAMPALG